MSPALLFRYVANVRYAMRFAVASSIASTLAAGMETGGALRSTRT